MAERRVAENCFLGVRMHLQGQKVICLLVFGNAELKALHLFGDELRETIVFDAAAETCA